jgi:C1A family cysteine protease
MAPEINKYSYNKSFKSSIYGDYIVIPTSYDLRNVDGKNYAPALKNQGNYGLCWTFSANTALESNLLLKNNDLEVFSERQLDFISATNGISDMTTSPYSTIPVFSRTLTDGGNNYIVSSLWANGVSPVLDSKFVPYNTTSTTLPIGQVINTDNVDYDVKGMKFEKTLDVTKYTADSKLTNEEKNYVKTYIEAIKSDLIENGALSTSIFWYFYNSSTRLLYNPGTANYNDYGGTAHAATIIGWDDNVGDVDGDGVNDGAWLAQNSWGSDDTNTKPGYYYISYYDADLYYNIMSVKDVDRKTWDNNYDFYTSDYQYSSTTDVNNVSTTKFTFNKTNNYEILNEIKVYNQYGLESPDTEHILYEVFVSPDNNDDNLISLGKYSEEELGYTTFYPSSVINLNNKQFAIYIVGSSNTPYYNVSVFTNDVYGSNAIFEMKNSSNLVAFQDAYDTIKLFSSGINSGEKYSYKFLDANDNDVTNLFTVYNNPIVNNYTQITFAAKDILSLNLFKIYVSYGSLEQVISYNVYKLEGAGTEENPYKIRTVDDLAAIGFGDESSIDRLGNAYYSLENSIDLSLATGEYGKYYNDGFGWKGKYFKGTFNGNGYTISGLNSGYSGLFIKMSDSKIYNLRFSNSNINIEVGDVINAFMGFITDIGINTEISGIYVDSTNNIKGPYVSCLGGKLNNVTIQNNYCEANVTGSTATMLAHEIRYVVVADNMRDLIIKNNYFNGSLKNIGDYYKSIHAYFANYLYNDKDEKITDTHKIDIEYNYYFNNADTSDTNYYYPSKSFGPASNFGVKSVEDPVIVTTDNVTYNNNDPLTADSRYLKETYIGYDFENIWNYETGKTPTLRIFSLPSNLPSIDLANKVNLENDPINYLFLNNDLLLKTDAKTILNIEDGVNYYLTSEDGVSPDNNNNLISTGNVVCLSNTYQQKCYRLIVPGDSNGDGEIDIYDIVAMKKDILGLEKMKDKNYQLAADYEKDDEIDIYDIVKAKKHILGL